MIFSSPKKHTLKQFQYLQSIDWASVEDPAVLLFLAEQCVQHGLRSAFGMLDHLESGMSLSGSAETRVSSLRRQLNAVDECCNPEVYFSDESLLAQIYSPSGYSYIETPGSKSLCVVFCTSFNNFYFSNLVLSLLLKRLGVSVLILKDDSPFHFLRGVQGVADDFASLAGFVREFSDQNGYHNLFLVGFSSGGYPALLCSTLIDFSALMVFSPRTDFSGAATADLVPELTTLVRHHLDVELRPFLPPLLAAANCQSTRRICYGGRSEFDVAQAGLLAGLPSFEFSRLEGSGHNTVANLMGGRRLLPCLQGLFSLVG